MAQRFSLDEYRWLTSREGMVWLERAGRMEGDLLRLLGRLRKDLGTVRASLVAEQLGLRRRGREKFPAADRMFFTPLGLEQATDLVVARYKANRFPSGSVVADLCCGIGGDLLGLAGRGPVVGVERDRSLARLAGANLRSAGPGSAGSGVCVGDVAQLPLAGFSAWHMDPDRRPQGRRTTQPQWHDPPSWVIDRLLDRCEDGALKLAPAADVPPGWQDRAEREWISRAGRCRQLVLWFGGLATAPGRRRATVLGCGPPRSLVGSSDAPPPPASRVGRYLFDPDPAVLCAGLLGALAGEHNLCGLAPGAAYLTGDQPVYDAAMSCFEVTDLLGFDRKRLRRLIRQRNIGVLEIKKRGLAVDPDQLRRQLSPRGDRTAVLILTRIGRHRYAMLARRVFSCAQSN